jgi:hypothetical protein
MSDIGDMMARELARQFIRTLVVSALCGAVGAIVMALLLRWAS